MEDTSNGQNPYKNPKGNQFKASHRKIIPGWKEHGPPYKLEANFWYLEWRSVGKPRSGLLYDNMRFFSNKCKYAKRRVLTAAEAIKRDRFWKPVLRVTKACLKS